MPNEFVIKNGFFSQGDSNVTGSINVSGSTTNRITGSLAVSSTVSSSLLYASTNISAPTIIATSVLSANIFNSAASGRLILSDGTQNGATASANLNYVGTAFNITGSTRISASAGNTPLTVIGSGSDVPIFRVQGSAGTLFSISDVVGGSLFSVTNASGTPLFDVNSSTTSSISGSLQIFTSGSNIISSSVRPLILSHNTNASATASLGVGIEFESETTTTENKTIGYLDYSWVNNTNGGEWGRSEITLQRSGSLERSHMFMPGVIGSFNGGLTAAHPRFGDTTGTFPEYRIYASGSTTDATQTSLRFALNEVTPTGLAVPNDTTWMFTIYVVARRTDADNESAAYWIQGCVDNNALTVALVGVPQVTAIEDTAAWDASVQIVGGRLTIRVTGEAAKTIYWNAITHIVQVSG